MCFLIFGYRVSTHVFFLFLLPSSSFLLSLSFPVRRFDLNNNGYITMKDFLRFARGSKGKSHLATELRKIIRHSELHRNLSLKAAFRAFDVEKTGHIQREQFEEMLRTLGFHPTQSEVRKLFQAIDKDDGGTVELVEFERWVRNESREEETSEETALWRSGGGDGGDGGDGGRSEAPIVPVELEEVQRKCRDAIERMSKESSTFDIEAVFEQVRSILCFCLSFVAVEFLLLFCLRFRQSLVSNIGTRL